MSDIRPVASLTSSLLARRGDARPAMRRQPVAHLHMPLAPQDDLGWNDTGEDTHQPQVNSMAAMDMPVSPLQVVPEAPVPAPIAEQSEPDPVSPLTPQLEAISERMSQAPRETSFKPMIERDRAPKTPPKAKVKAPVIDDAHHKAAFTLRIDPERHLRLRLLSALVHRSSQQLLIEALDALLGGHGEVEDLAARVESGATSPRKTARL